MVCNQLKKLIFLMLLCLPVFSQDFSSGGAATGGTGTVTSVATTPPISGGTITSTGTISCPNCVDKTSSNTYSASTTQAMDTATAKYWGTAPVFDATKYAGADMCVKIAAVYADTAYSTATYAVIDATGFTGSQNCSVNAVNVTIPTWIKLGAVTVHDTFGQTFPHGSVSTRLTTPATPTAASTTTTGGTLSGSVFVKVTLSAMLPGNLGSVSETLPSAELTVSMNAACPGTPTCTATINSPTAQVGSAGYYVYQANTTGTEKLCTPQPIPFGINYVIKANCAGVVVPGIDVADVNVSVFSGVSDQLTIWSLEAAGANFNVNGYNWIFKDFSLVTSRTDQSASASMTLFANTVVQDMTFVGGKRHILINGGPNVFVRNVKHAGLSTAGGGEVVMVNGSAFNVKISNQIFLPQTWPAGGTFAAGVYVQTCSSGCSVDNVRGDHLDMSNVTNGGLVVFDKSSGWTVTGVQCDFMINADCVSSLNLSSNGNISNVNASNTNINTGVGTNLNNGDVLDIQSSSNVSFDNIKGQTIGLTSNSAARFPSYEIYNSYNISGSNFQALDGNAEGMKVFGTPSVSFVNYHALRMWNSGVVFQDGATTVSCNTTTTVTYTGGSGFGPWPPGTIINIGASAFVLASTPTSVTGTLTLTTTCSLGAGQTLSVYTQDATLSDAVLDDNGKNGTGTGSRTGTAEGIYASGHSIVMLMGGIAGNNLPTASMTQQYGARAENTARLIVALFNGSANVGGASCLLDIANHAICDSPKTSAVQIDDGAGEVWGDSGVKRVAANVTNSTTTMANLTGMFWTIAANRSYALTCELIYQAASTGGLQFAFTGPASPTQAEYCIQQDASSTALTNGTACTPPANASFATKVGAGVVSTAAANLPARLTGLIENGTTAGVLQIQFASSAAVATTVERGSFCSLKAID